jgi:hypothetical protein
MRLRRRRVPPKLRELSFDEELELVCGPGRDANGNPVSAFQDEAERRGAWETHRERLMGDMEGKPGRSWAWEAYECH